jgi:putative aminopeptidase FrvX
MNLELLQRLIEVASATGEEYRMKSFLMDYIYSEMGSWENTPEIIAGDPFQDCLMLVFGQPTTAVYVHMDTVGFTVRYQNQLITIGSPEPAAGDKLIGQDQLGAISCQIEVDENGHFLQNFSRGISRGTTLTYRPNFIESSQTIASPYLDNRIGLFVALQLARQLSDGVLVFTAGEEHGGGYAGYLSRYLYETYKVRQALIADVTWVTGGVLQGDGAVISMRDSFIPRRKFVDNIIRIATNSGSRFQLEVEASGGSDGSEIHQLPYPVDWCFIGVPVTNPHSAQESVARADLSAMIKLYTFLLKQL